MVRHTQREAEQADDEAEQALGLLALQLHFSF